MARPRSLLLVSLLDWGVLLLVVFLHVPSLRVAAQVNRDSVYLAQHFGGFARSRPSLISLKESRLVLFDSVLGQRNVVRSLQHLGMLYLFEREYYPGLPMWCLASRIQSSRDPLAVGQFPDWISVPSQEVVDSYCEFEAARGTPLTIASPEFEQYFGHVLEETGRAAEAVSVFQKLEQAQTWSADIEFALARSCEVSGDIPCAEQHFRALLRDPVWRVDGAFGLLRLAEISRDPVATDVMEGYICREGPQYPVDLHEIPEGLRLAGVTYDGESFEWGKRSPVAFFWRLSSTEPGEYTPATLQLQPVERLYRACGYLVQMVEVTNLIANGGFEWGRSMSGVPVGWTPYVDSSPVGLFGEAKDRREDGNESVVLTLCNAQNNGRALLVSDPILLDSEYVLQAGWLKENLVRDGKQDGIRYGVLQFDSSGREVGHVYVLGGTLSRPGWAYVSGVFRAAGQGDYIRGYVGNYDAAGTVYADGLVLLPISIPRVP